MKEVSVSLWEITQEEALTLPTTVPVLAFNTWTSTYFIAYNEKGSFIRDKVSSRHIKYLTFINPTVYIKRGQSVVGRLTKNRDGRYCISDDVYFTSGDSIEIFFGDSWLLTRIEHDGKDYYAVDLLGVPLHGLTARLPENHLY